MIAGRPATLMLPQYRRQPHRVEGGFHFDVVVEVDEDVAGLEAFCRLVENPPRVRRFAAGLRTLGLSAREDSAIFPVLAGAPERAVACSARLREEGLLVRAIRPPTVPEGTSRLRFALSAAHTDAHVDRALAALRAAL